MPEYLAPGVYVEEVSFRSKSIEGVPTSTTGFSGLAHYGPVRYPGGPKNPEPRLITSFTEFERVYGSLNELEIAGGRPAYLAHAARAFFDNGGKRLYVSRVYRPRDGDVNLGVASRAITDGALTATWKARWPGSMGNVLVQTVPVRSRVTVSAAGKVQRVKDGAVIEVLAAGTTPPAANAPITLANLRIVQIDQDGNQTFDGGAAPASTNVVHLVELMVLVQSGNDRSDQYSELGGDPAQTRYIGTILQKDDPADENALIYLEWDTGAAGATAASLMALLTSATATGRLINGNDGDMPLAAAFAGSEADPDDPLKTATGLAALGDITTSRSSLCLTLRHLIPSWKFLRRPSRS